jgi:tetraacyldisaccharide 4'-kinase
MLFLRLLISPFAPLYSFIIWIRNKFFDTGIFKIKKVNAKVISIGNITLGGSGKTPAVIYVVDLIKRLDKKVGVLSRGYGRKSKGYFLISDGKAIKQDVFLGGDEITLTAQKCKIPAAVCEDRVEGAKRLLQDVDVDVIVLDDAFQHRWIYRDIDILIFDQRFLNKAGGLDHNILPLGVMRESFKSIKRADIIIINRKFSEIMNLPLSLRPYFEGKKIFSAGYKAAGFYDVKNHQCYEINEFCGQKSLVVSGIAKPFSFLRILELNNINIENRLMFKDHKNYTEKDIELIRKEFYATNSHSVITTEKDAVKLNTFSKELDDIDIYYLKIELEIDEKEELEAFFRSKL